MLFSRQSLQPILLFRGLALSLVLAGLPDWFVISAICNFKPSTSFLILDISDTLAVKLSVASINFWFGSLLSDGLFAWTWETLAPFLLVGWHCFLARSSSNPVASFIWWINSWSVIPNCFKNGFKWARIFSLDKPVPMVCRKTPWIKESLYFIDSSSSEQ